MKKKLPKFKNDAAVEKFLERDLSPFIDRDHMTPVTFEFAPKDRTVNIRVSKALLDAVKMQSRKKGISYQKFIRQAVEDSLRKAAA